MKSSELDFYYFSGTGNTYLVVKKMKETFEEHGISTNMLKIEDSKPEDVNLNHTIGIAFPVAILSTYPFVWDFINQLPPADCTEIFMVDTLGGFSGGIVGPFREIVKKKGYTPIGAREIIMPLNIFYVMDEESNKKRVQEGLINAEEYATQLINGEAKWGRIPFFSDATYYVSLGSLKLSQIDLHHKLFLFNADKEKCNQCGICVDLCPLGNISMEEGEYPVHGLNCEYCLRCTSLCPKQAIPNKFNYKSKNYQAVKARELL